MPKKINIPKINFIKNNKYITEAKQYINKYFKFNYGSLDNFIYPIDRKQTIKWLIEFLNKRLINFGLYEDAVSEKEIFIYHSVLSPMMNIGLITDIEVVNISYQYYLQNTDTISIQSFEGFIRQIIGWRNYVYLIYSLEGKTMFEMNNLGHYNKINSRWWNGTTNIKPIDNLIYKINNYAYIHHIERLMYLGNFMLLCNIHPKEVYNIFMEWTIDSYDWVMIPNIFGMSQYASSIMTTRIYFSSYNYINKMSTYKYSKKLSNEKDYWCNIWNALYYSFINKHYKLLKINYATSRQVKHWDNKNDNDKITLLKTAKKYINKYIKN